MPTNQSTLDFIEGKDVKYKTGLSKTLPLIIPQDTVLAHENRLKRFETRTDFSGPTILDKCLYRSIDKVKGVPADFYRSSGTEYRDLFVDIATLDNTENFGYYYTTTGQRGARAGSVFKNGTTYPLFDTNQPPLETVDVDDETKRVRQITHVENLRRISSPIN
jgi:hypothetical protein